MNKKQMMYHMGQTNQQHQRGLTLIEVLVSVIVMVLGILALLAAQLRSVANVREAEAQTVVTQATQNLVEGMLTNPVLCSSRVSSSACPTSWGTTAKGWSKKNYSHYAPANAATTCGALANGATLSKNALAAYQLCKFNNELKANLQGAIWSYTICIDSGSSNDGEPIITGTPDSGYAVDFRCDGKGDNTVVKVVWQMDSTETTNVDAANNRLTAERAIYSYQTYVTN